MLWGLLSNLRVRFLLLVLLAVLPALGLLILTASEQRDQAVALEREGTRRLANLAAADQSRLIDGTRQLLIVLARLPEVQSAGPECDQLLSSLLSQFPSYSNLGVISPDGAVTCSAVPPPLGLNLAERADVRGTLESGQFTIGEYRTDGTGGNPVLNTAYPIANAENETVGVVYAAINLASLGQFASVELRDDSIVTVTDRNGTVLVRRPQDDVAVGASLADDPTFETIRAEGNGVTEGEIGDQDFVIGFATLTGDRAGSAYLSIARPKSAILSGPEAAFSRNLTRLGLVVLVVMVAAWVGGDLLARRSADAHKELVRRIYDAFTTGRVDLLDDVVDAGFIDHDPMPGQAPGLPGLKQAVGLFRAAFPDGEMLINELVAEGDMVVARVTLHGTHTGDYFGRKGSSKSVTADGIEIFRVSRDKVCEGWSRFVLPEDGLVPESLDAEDTMVPIDDVNGFTPVPEEIDNRVTAGDDSRRRDS